MPHRAFTYPLNVLVHVIAREEGGVSALHYGLFAEPGESIAAAQARSTDLLLARLPPPPARILDVGAGLGGLLDRLAQLGYDAEGLTPDPAQVAAARSRYGDRLRVIESTLEAFAAPPTPFDLVLFQESSQYIDAAALFSKARWLGPRVLVLDEFSTAPDEAAGRLHSLPRFLACAARSGFQVTASVDLSASAAPTVAYFLERLPRHRAALVAALGVTDAQVDDLISSGVRYRDAYRNGTYVYRLLDFSRPA
jgi:SAM-dependent methyltransferase